MQFPQGSLLSSQDIFFFKQTETQQKFDLSFNFSRTLFKSILSLFILYLIYFPLKQIVLNGVYKLVAGNVLSYCSFQCQTTNVSPISTLEPVYEGIKYLQLLTFSTNSYRSWPFFEDINNQRPFK